VRPGDVLRHQVRLLRTIGDTWVVAGDCRVGDSAVLQVGRVTIALRPAEVLRGSVLAGTGGGPAR
jgi:3-hydroxyacyl-[acyl-carrier-protein] dehydratase